MRAVAPPCLGIRFANSAAALNNSFQAGGSVTPALGRKWEIKVPAKSKLRSALRAIDNAASSLRRARDNVDPDSAHQIRRALNELGDAERDIKRAISEVPDD